MNRRLLPVGGLVRFSTVDYPGQFDARLARCRRLSRAAARLARCRDLQRCEPTLHAGLEAAVREVRALGFRIRLHSAGIYPSRLAQLLPLIDWIGLDIKAPFDEYARITGVSRSGDKALAAARLVLDSDVDYEFRTTLHAALLSARDVEKLALQLAALGVRRYALQTFRAVGCTNEALIRTAPQMPELPVLAETLTRMFKHFELRAT